MEPHGSEKRVRRAGDFVWSCATGLANGVAVGTLYFLLEPIGLYHGALPYIGTPLVTILGVYASFGAVVGLLAGALVALVARRTRLRVPGASLAVVGWVFTVVFIGRFLSTEELVSFPVREALLSVVALVVWSAVGWMLGRGSSGVSGSRKLGWVAAGGSVAFLIVLAVWNPIFYYRFPKRGVPDGPAPNVVMIVVDAMRSDHLSAYGYQRDTSPNMKKLADSGVRFDRAYSQGNRTAISMPALFTSMYPASNGAVGFQDRMTPLPEERKTIAEILQDRGYVTAGMMSNIYLKSAYQLDQGLDRTEEFNNVRFRFSVYRMLLLLGLVEKPAYARGESPNGNEVTDAAIQWLDRIPKDAPYFLFVHYMDVHHKYRPPAAHEKLFRSSPEVSSIDPDSLFQKTKKLIAEAPPIDISDAELQRLKDLYDASIHYADSEIGRLVSALEARDGARDTVVLLTADHGDEFMEHGSIYHVNLVNQELLRVPLIVWDSEHRFGPRRVEGMARHIDVLPTIAELCGATVPQGAEGTSLVPLMDGSTDEVAHVSYAEGDFCTAVIYDQWKVMHVDTSDVYTLYDLAHDPDGLVDVSGRYPEEFDSLKTMLDDYMARAAVMKRRERKMATEETIRQLRALGYVN
jgi:arylsulfatase A-like enzyme